MRAYLQEGCRAIFAREYVWIGVGREKTRDKCRVLCTCSNPQRRPRRSFAVRLRRGDVNGCVGVKKLLNDSFVTRLGHLCMREVGE